jgi:hypothetical protein
MRTEKESQARLHGRKANFFFITLIGIGSTRLTILKLSFSVRLNSMDLKNTRAPSNA